MTVTVGNTSSDGGANGGNQGGGSSANNNNNQQQTQQPQQPSKPKTFCGNWNVLDGSWGAFNIGLGAFALIPEPVEPAVAVVAGVSGLANGISAAAEWVVCP